jgi:hypothetical protein
MLRLASNKGVMGSCREAVGLFLLCALWYSLKQRKTMTEISPSPSGSMMLGSILDSSEKVDGCMWFQGFDMFPA